MAYAATRAGPLTAASSSSVARNLPLGRSSKGVPRSKPTRVSHKSLTNMWESAPIFRTLTDLDLVGDTSTEAGSADYQAPRLKGPNSRRNRAFVHACSRRHQTHPHINLAAVKSKRESGDTDQNRKL